MPPVDIIDLQLLRQVEGTVAEGWGWLQTDELIGSGTSIVRMATAPEAILAEVGTGSIATAASTVALPLTIGAYVETTLLKNEHWDNFWIHAGANLNNWWHTSANFLFGAPSVTMHEVGQAINLSQHLTMRAVKQLYSRVTAKATAGITNLARVARFQQHEISQLARGHLALSKWTASHILGAIQAAEVYSNRQLNKYKTDVNNRLNVERLRAQQWATDHILRPVQTALSAVNDRVSMVQASIPTVAKAVALPLIATAVAPLTKTLTQHSARLKALEQEAKTCTEPMCETFGPKSDWGKLLKKYKPALFYALLAELALLNPDEVGRASVDLAEGLGPVLEHWVAKYIGILPGGTHDQPSEVTHAIGHNPLGL